MKSKKTTLNDLSSLYNHPSIVLFRAIELKTIYDETKDLSFNHPSLDLGCGDGKISQLIFDEKFTYGVDNGEANDYQDAIKKDRYEKVLLESAEKMSLPDSSVNFVFSNSVVEHIPDCEAVIGEVSRILKKGGRYIFTAPSHKFGDYLYLTQQLRKLKLNFLANLYIKFRNKMLNHFHLYSYENWKPKLEKHGLQVKDYKYYLSSKALSLWDKMSLLLLIEKVFVGRRAFRLVYKKYQDEILSLYQNDNLKDNL